MRVFYGLTLILACILIFSLIDSYSAKKNEKNSEKKAQKNSNTRSTVKNKQKVKKEKKNIVYKNEICFKHNEVPIRSDFSKLKFFNQVNGRADVSDQYVIPYELNLLNKDMVYTDEVYMSAWVRPDSNYIPINNTDENGYFLSVEIVNNNQFKSINNQPVSSFIIRYNYKEKSWSFEGTGIDKKRQQRLGAVDLPPGHWHSIGLYFSKQKVDQKDNTEGKYIEKGYILIGTQPHPYKIILNKEFPYFKTMSKIIASFGVQNPRSNISSFQGDIFGAY